MISWLSVMLSAMMILSTMISILICVVFSKFHEVSLTLLPKFFHFVLIGRWGIYIPLAGTESESALIKQTLIYIKIWTKNPNPSFLFPQLISLHFFVRWHPHKSTTAGSRHSIFFFFLYTLSMAFFEDDILTKKKRLGGAQRTFSTLMMMKKPKALRKEYGYKRDMFFFFFWITIIDFLLSIHWGLLLMMMMHTFTAFVFF